MAPARDGNGYWNVMDKTTPRYTPADFRDVDRAPDPQAFVRFLDGLRPSAAFRAYKNQTFSALELQPGDAVLDVGCGPGDDIFALAELVGANGRAVGVDRSETMITEARRRAHALGLPVE